MDRASRSGRGLAWGSVNRDGSINLRLDAIPTNGTLQIRDYEERDGAPRPQEGQSPASIPRSRPSDGLGKHRGREPRAKRRCGRARLARAPSREFIGRLSTSLAARLVRPARAAAAWRRGAPSPAPRPPRWGSSCSQRSHSPARRRERPSHTRGHRHRLRSRSREHPGSGAGRHAHRTPLPARGQVPPVGAAPTRARLPRAGELDAGRPGFPGPGHARRPAQAARRRRQEGAGHPRAARPAPALPSDSGSPQGDEGFAGPRRRSSAPSSGSISCWPRHRRQRPVEEALRLRPLDPADAAPDGGARPPCARSPRLRW